MHLHCLPSVAIALLLCSSSFTAEIHVTTSGDDKNTGTNEAPFKSIQAGIAAAKSGDTVIVAKGVYRERVEFTKSGEADKRITIRAVPRRSVVMEGFVFTGNYVTVEGFQITHLAFGNRQENGLECRGDFNELIDNFIYEVQKKGLVSSGQNRIARNKISKVALGMTAQGKKYVAEENEISRIYNWGFLDGDYARFFGEDGVWRKNFFHGNVPGEQHGHPDGFQTFDDNGEFARNILIENNLVGDTVAAGMIQAWYGKKSGDIVFRNNVFYNLLQGISGSTMPNMTVTNNVFYKVTQRCGEGGPGSVWKNNIYASCLSTVSSDYSVYYKVPQKKTGANCLVEVDPLFVDPDKLDFHLKPGSPAIDAGDPSTPVPPGGGNRVDIGAYEYTAAATK